MAMSFPNAPSTDFQWKIATTVRTMRVTASACNAMTAHKKFWFESFADGEMPIFGLVPKLMATANEIIKTNPQVQRGHLTSSAEKRRLAMAGFMSVLRSDMVHSNV